MRLCLNIALQMQGVIVGWQVYELTHDPFALGLIGLSEVIPAVSVSLFAGHIADIFPKKRIIFLCLILLFLCSVAIFSLTFYTDFVIQQTHLIYGIIFLTGLGRGFLGPAIFSSMPLLVNKNQYADAVIWNTTLWHFAAVSGPALGGLIFSFLGFSYSYLIVMILILCSLCILFTIHIPFTALSKKADSVFNSIKEGIDFVFKNELILAAISLDLFAVLFGGAVALLPIFASEILDTGARGLGILRAAPAVGAVFMSVMIGFYPIRKYAGMILLTSVACFGLTIIAFALSKIFILSLIILVVNGMFDSVSVICRQTLMQTLTPPELKGRVSSVNNIFIGSSNELGAFESGFAAKIMGLIPSVIFGGCVTLLTVLVAGFSSKKLRDFHFSDKVLK